MSFNVCSKFLIFFVALCLVSPSQASNTQMIDMLTELRQDITEMKSQTTSNGYGTVAAIALSAINSVGSLSSQIFGNVTTTESTKAVSSLQETVSDLTTLIGSPTESSSESETSLFSRIGAPADSVSATDASGLYSQVASLEARISSLNTSKSSCPDSTDCNIVSIINAVNSYLIEISTFWPGKTTIGTTTLSYSDAFLTNMDSIINPLGSLLGGELSATIGGVIDPTTGAVNNPGAAYDLAGSDSSGYTVSQQKFYDYLFGAANYFMNIKTMAKTSLSIGTTSSYVDSTDPVDKETINSINEDFYDFFEIVKRNTMHIASCMPKTSYGIERVGTWLMQARSESEVMHYPSFTQDGDIATDSITIQNLRKAKPAQTVPDPSISIVEA